MPTPQDDFFNDPGLVLDAKWSFAERTGSPDLGFSLSDVSNNISITVKPEAKLPENLTQLTRLLQDSIHNEYLIEANITQSNVAEPGHEFGLIVTEDDETYVLFVKSFQGGEARLRIYSKLTAADAVLVEEIAFTDDTNIQLRIENLNGVFKFFYKSEEDTTFIEAASTVV